MEGGGGSTAIVTKKISQPGQKVWLDFGLQPASCSRGRFANNVLNVQLSTCLLF